MERGNEARAGRAPSGLAAPGERRRKPWLHSGHLADAFVKSVLRLVCTFVRRRRNYISVGTLRMFIETSARHLQSLDEPIPRMHPREF